MMYLVNVGNMSNKSLFDLFFVKNYSFDKHYLSKHFKEKQICLKTAPR